MKRFFVTALAGLLLAVPLSQTGAAQELHRGTFLQRNSTGVASVALADLTDRCPEEAPNACDVYAYPVVSRDCAVVAIDSLGSDGGSNLQLVRYLSSVTYQESGTETWTCESDAAVLLDVSVEARAIPVWHDATERTFEYIRGGRIAEHGGAEILAVQYCLNGTGGCYDNLLLRREDNWRFLRRDSTWGSVYAQLPAGYQIHKSPGIDVENLTWEQHLAGPHDANCCPSGRLFLELGLVDSLLTVKKARLEAELTIE